jgi:hypothetical protein
VIKIDKTGASILAALILEDIRGYSERFPDEFAEFCKAEQVKQKAPSIKKQRKSRRISR